MSYDINKRSCIQVSFGLKNYQLPFCKEVYILADAYQAFGSKDLYIGHVSPTGIYISWKHFVHGFANYKDGVNVALHEMAHALYHEILSGKQVLIGILEMTLNSCLPYLAR